MTDVIRKYGNPNFPEKEHHSRSHFNRQPKNCLREAKCVEVLKAKFEGLEVDNPNHVKNFTSGVNKLVKHVRSLNPQWSRSSRFLDKKMSTNNNPTLTPNRGDGKHAFSMIGVRKLRQRSYREGGLEGEGAPGGPAG